MNTSPTNDSVSIKSDSFIKEIIKVLLIALIVVLPVRILIAQPFIVSGSSMDPTFENGDYLIVDQLSYRFGDPERLDVVIFKYPKDPNKFFIKRIIGLPGETVSINNGSVSINSDNMEEMVLNEKYVVHTRKDTVTVFLEEDEYYVMGDNRSASLDSRSWGPLPSENVVGKAMVRLLPISKFNIAPGSDVDNL